MIRKHKPAGRSAAALQHRAHLWHGLIISLFMFAGCAPTGPERVVVRGAVTFDGQPVENGEIKFFPDGFKAPLSGATIVNGEYIVSAHDGVPVGTHRVEIRAFRAPDAQGQNIQGNAASMDTAPAAEQYLPSRFNTDTQLRVTVSAAQDRHDFALTD